MTKEKPQQCPSCILMQEEGYNLCCLARDVAKDWQEMWRNKTPIFYRYTETQEDARQNSAAHLPKLADNQRRY